MNFAMSDIYGGIYGTTELTNPEPAEQQALVDDYKMSEEVTDYARKKKPLLFAVIIIFALVVLFGVKK